MNVDDKLREWLESLTDSEVATLADRKKQLQTAVTKEAGKRYRARGGKTRSEKKQEREAKQEEERVSMLGSNPNADDKYYPLRRNNDSTLSIPDNWRAYIRWTYPISYITEALNQVEETGIIGLRKFCSLLNPIGRRLLLFYMYTEAHDSNDGTSWLFPDAATLAAEVTDEERDSISAVIEEFPVEIMGFEEEE